MKTRSSSAGKRKAGGVSDTESRSRCGKKTTPHPQKRRKKVDYAAASSKTSGAAAAVQASSSSSSSPITRSKVAPKQEIRRSGVGASGPQASQKEFAVLGLDAVEVVKDWCSLMYKSEIGRLESMRAKMKADVEEAKKRCEKIKVSMAASDQRRSEIEREYNENELDINQYLSQHTEALDEAIQLLKKSLSATDRLGDCQNTLSDHLGTISDLCKDQANCLRGVVAFRSVLGSKCS